MKQQNIIKQNSLIFGKFSSAYKETDLDIVNTLILNLQNARREGGELLNLLNYDALIKNKINITSFNIRKNSNIKEVSNSDIFKILKNIRDISVILSNFTDYIFIDGKEEKITYKFKTLSIIDSVGMNEAADGRTENYEIIFNPLFLKLTLSDFNKKVGNHTIITLSDVTSLSSKHAKRLYESILSRKKLKNFTLNHENLNSIFGLKNKPWSYAKRTFLRQIEKIKPLIYFKFEIHDFDKKISIEIVE